MERGDGGKKRPFPVWLASAVPVSENVRTIQTCSPAVVATPAAHSAGTAPCRGLGLGRAPPETACYKTRIPWQFHAPAQTLRSLPQTQSRRSPSPFPQADFLPEDRRPVPVARGKPRNPCSRLPELELDEASFESLRFLRRAAVYSSQLGYGGRFWPKSGFWPGFGHSIFS